MEEHWTTLEWLEAGSYLATIFSLVAVPAGFLWGVYEWRTAAKEKRKEAADKEREEAKEKAEREERLRIDREKEIEKIGDDLYEGYDDILRDLQSRDCADLNDHSKSNGDKDFIARQNMLYERIINFFEWAFFRTYDPDPAYMRIWIEWEGDLDEWLGKENLKSALVELMSSKGRNREFLAYMEKKTGKTFSQPQTADPAVPNAPPAP